MTNKQLYNRIRTSNNKVLKQTDINTLKQRAALGNKEAQQYMDMLKPLDQRPTKASKS